RQVPTLIGCCLLKICLPRQPSGGAAAKRCVRQQQKNKIMPFFLPGVNCLLYYAALPLLPKPPGSSPARLAFALSPWGRFGRCVTGAEL
ncbi:MAG: hypothetical protein ACO1N5_06610, partial [Noviherbaspirillum sp.]